MPPTTKSKHLFFGVEFVTHHTKPYLSYPTRLRLNSSCVPVAVFQKHPANPLQQESVLVTLNPRARRRGWRPMGTLDSLRAGVRGGNGRNGSNTLRYLGTFFLFSLTPFCSRLSRTHTHTYWHARLHTHIDAYTFTYPTKHTHVTGISPLYSIVFSEKKKERGSNSQTANSRISGVVLSDRIPTASESLVHMHTYIPTQHTCIHKEALARLYYAFR
jgi:hypothetical protein